MNTEKQTSRTIFLLLALIFCSSPGFSQSLIGLGGAKYLQGKIFLEDGSSKEGLVQIPKRPSSQKIKFKLTEQSNAEKIKINSIKSFSVTSEMGEKYELESNYIDQSLKENVQRVTKFRIFLVVEVSGYASLYKIGDEFRVDKNGNLFLYSYNAGDGTGAVNFKYYIKKKGADYAELFTIENPVNGFLPDMSRKSVVKAMEIHLSEYPELIEKVRNKEIDKMNLVHIFKLYNDHMNIKNPPDSIPKIFGKGLITFVDRAEWGLAITPSYDEIFFTATDGLMIIKKEKDGSWSSPEVANLRGDNKSEMEAFYTLDAEQLYFTSGDTTDTNRIWRSFKEKSGWSKAELLNSPVNSTPVFWATFSSTNTMYYTNLAVGKIYRSELVDGEYSETSDLGIEGFQLHPAIAADESSVLFNSRRTDSYVEHDIYIGLEKIFSTP